MIKELNRRLSGRQVTIRGIVTEWHATPYVEGGRVCIRGTCVGGSDCVPGEVWGNLTLNETQIQLDAREILVKTYSEGEETAKALLAAMPDIFEDTGRRVPLSHVVKTGAHVWRIRPDDATPSKGTVGNQ